MAFPHSLRETLSTVRQAAVELVCEVDGQREFISVWHARANKILGFEARFPYFVGCEAVFRVVRFRVDARLIENDFDCSTDELIDLQQMYFSSEEMVENVLSMWNVRPESLLAPKYTEIPI